MNEPTHEDGLLIVYTGNGKGKTTAAFGLALRMLGHGKRVCVIQFIKSKKTSGELAIAKRWKDQVTVHVTGSGFIRSTLSAERHRAESVAAWNLAKTEIASGSYDLVVLDELTHLIRLGLVDEADVLAALAARPRRVTVVVTGRNASAALVAAADTATEMKELKHAYNRGVRARAGIEW